MKLNKEYKPVVLDTNNKELIVDAVVNLQGQKYVQVNYHEEGGIANETSMQIPKDLWTRWKNGEIKIKRNNERKNDN